MKRFCVCILASRPGGTLYIGVTSDLARRVHEHRTGAVPGFTQRYNIKQLMHVEVFETAMDAIQREKSLKRWPRAWKSRLIGEGNPTWRDLYEEMAGGLG
jgi:putative endonuclease